MKADKKPIRSFEELDVCKLAREFSRKVSKLIKMLSKEEEYNLKPQMKASAPHFVLCITYIY